MSSGDVTSWRCPAPASSRADGNGCRPIECGRAVEEPYRAHAGAVLAFLLARVTGPAWVGRSESLEEVPLAPRPWRDGFFVAADGRKPAEGWLLELPAKPAAEVIAVITAVRDAPPPAFAGGGKWEAMHGEMAGIYEVRCRQGGQLHRLFCLLDRNHPDGPALVILDGDSEPNRDARVRLSAGP